MLQSAVSARAVRFDERAKESELSARLSVVEAKLDRATAAIAELTGAAALLRDAAGELSDAVAALVRNKRKDKPPLDLPKIRRIQELVATEFGTTVFEILSNRAGKDVNTPRKVAMYLARELTLHSLPTIGREFNNRDHTTILSGCRKVEKMIRADADLSARVGKLRAAMVRDISAETALAAGIPR